MSTGTPRPHSDPLDGLHLQEKRAPVDRLDLVVCDEVGYIPFNPKEAQLLFHFFACRYERGSVVVQVTWNMSL
ncbi:MAG: ATP-binding protein [Bacillota bacterium]|nr:ATP-binding protein [Bacillota bacterium]